MIAIKYCPVFLIFFLKFGFDFQEVTKFHKLLTSSHLFLFASFSVFTVGKTSGHVPSWFGSTSNSWLPSGQKSSLKDALHTPKSNVAVKISPINFAMFANLDWIENWYDAHLLCSENNFQSYCCEQQFLRIFLNSNLITNELKFA